jgi:hypothetical protein
MTRMAMAPPTGTPAPVARPREGSAAGPANACAELGYRLRGLVRDIRVEVQNIGRSLATVEAALALTDPKLQASELKAALAETDGVVGSNRHEVDVRLAEIDEILRTCPRLHDHVGDELATIDNLWRRVDGLLAAPGGTPIEARATLDAVRPLMADVEWHVALVTLPQRLNQHLSTLRVGGQLSFDDAFGDELADPAQRRRLLDYLRAHPGAVHGAIDAERGVIYRVARSARRRLASYLGLAALLAVGGGLFAAFVSGGWPPFVAADWLLTGNRFDDLVGAYAVLALGAVSHIVVEALKQQQTRGTGAFLALGDWLTWIHVREVSIGVGIVSLWVALIALAVAYPTGIDRLAAFFAGYSLDSVIGVVISRVDTLAAARADELTTRLRGDSAS